MALLAKFVCLLLWAIGVQAAAWAQGDASLDATLGERMEMVTLPGAFSLQLETTFFVPEGAGPFPVVVINHGKAFGNPRFQARSRPVHAVRFFLQRSYAVIVPMRRGFSKSGGSYGSAGCNVESNGLSQAQDVRAVLDHVLRQGWADAQRILIVGQSHGGWTTLAFGSQPYPGVRGLVNFAGGLRQEQCDAWEGSLVRAAEAYGRQSRLPSLWLYGDNDSYFPPEVFRPMHARYIAGGAPAKLVAYGRFGADAHELFGSTAGARIWQPVVTEFLRSIDLPSEPQPGFERYGSPPAVALQSNQYVPTLDSAHVSQVGGTKQGARP